MSMKNLNIFLRLISFIIFTSSISLAETTASMIVDKFIIAVQSKDQTKINEAIEELKINFDAQNILKDNWPNYFTLFNLTQISKRIENLKKTYGFSSSEVIIEDVTSNTSKGLFSNKDLVLSRNTSNRVLSRQQNLTSNSQTVRNFSNQDQESNQERIRRRR